MTANGIFQLAALPGRPARPGQAARAPTWPASTRASRCGLDRALGPLERLIYRSSGVRPDRGDGLEDLRRGHAALQPRSACSPSTLLQRLQGVLPLNPQGLGAVSPDSSFNTAVSFATNTNWQGYGGETTMSYLTQMLGLTVQNFVSAATGMAVLVALIRGFARRSAQTIGNFWVDLTRTHALHPAAAVPRRWRWSSSRRASCRPSGRTQRPPSCSRPSTTSR